MSCWVASGTTILHSSIKDRASRLRTSPALAFFPGRVRLSISWSHKDPIFCTLNPSRRILILFGVSQPTGISKVSLSRGLAANGKGNRCSSLAANRTLAWRAVAPESFVASDGGGGTLNSKFKMCDRTSLKVSGCAVVVCITDAPSVWRQGQSDTVPDVTDLHLSATVRMVCMIHSTLSSQLIAFKCSSVSSSPSAM